MGNLNVFTSKESVTLLWLKQYPVDSTLTQMMISMIRLWFDSYPWFSRPTRLIWIRVESNSTHDSWVGHNPVSDLVWRFQSCLTLCDLFGPYLTLCDLVTSDMTLENIVWPWGDLVTFCLTLCDLFSPYLTLCDMSFLGWSCVTLSVPIWPCVTSSLLVWPCVTLSVPIWPCVTSSVAAWSSVTLSFRDLVWPCHSLSDVVWPPISLSDLVWSFQHLYDLVGGGAVVWRTFLEAAVLDVAARLPQHHRDVSGRRSAVPPASTAPCSASEAGRCHGSWTRRVAPCPRGWGAVTPDHTAFYRPHSPRESLCACYGSADLVVSLPRRTLPPSRVVATGHRTRPLIIGFKTVRWRAYSVRWTKWSNSTRLIYWIACPRGELRRDVVQMRQFNCLCVELAALVSAGSVSRVVCGAACRPNR